MAARSENNPTSLVDKFILARLVANFMKSESPKRELKIACGKYLIGERAIFEFWDEKEIRYAWSMLSFSLNIIYRACR